jgi:AraC-like DNA-binding protein
VADADRRQAIGGARRQGLSTLAFEVGYASEAAFSRAFKKLVGRSPGQWRAGTS